jgi:hypothetical protein
MMLRRRDGCSIFAVTDDAQRKEIIRATQKALNLVFIAFPLTFPVPADFVAMTLVPPAICRTARGEIPILKMTARKVFSQNG